MHLALLLVLFVPVYIKNLAYLHTNNNKTITYYASDNILSSSIIITTKSID